MKANFQIDKKSIQKKLYTEKKKFPPHNIFVLLDRGVLYGFTHNKVHLKKLQFALNNSPVSFF